MVSVETQTEIPTAHVEVQTTPISVRPQTTLVSVEAQTIEVRDEMEDKRQRGKNAWHLQPVSSVWRPLAFLPVTLSVSCTAGGFLPSEPPGVVWLEWRRGGRGQGAGEEGD